MESFSEKESDTLPEEKGPAFSSPMMDILVKSVRLTVLSMNVKGGPSLYCEMMWRRYYFHIYITSESKKIRLPCGSSHLSIPPIGYLNHEIVLHRQTSSAETCSLSGTSHNINDKLAATKTCLRHRAWLRPLLPEQEEMISSMCM